MGVSSWEPGGSQFLARVDLAQKIPHGATDLDVHSCGRLVQDEKPRLVHEGAGDHQPALHAAGQAARHLVPLVPQLQLLEILLGALARDRPRNSVEPRLIHHDGVRGLEHIEVDLLGNDADAAVLAAVEMALTEGAGVLLQIMDASKLGWRAPSQACLDEIARRWPHKVVVAVDACQMRLSRRRLRFYLDRGYMVLVTGSKFFGGPPFSGALLVPSLLSLAPQRGEGMAAGLADYANRNDWPQRWSALRSRFESRPNLGQWLRWEAALEEIKAYYAIPDAWRAKALRQYRAGIEDLVALSSSLRLAGVGVAAAAEDEEFAEATIFPFTLNRHGGALSLHECRALHCVLAQDLSSVIDGGKVDRGILAQRCLIGQPVRIERPGLEPTAVLRLCVGARQLTETWSADAVAAEQNLQRELDAVAEIVAKIELLLASSGERGLTEL